MHKIETLKFASEWTKRTGPGSGSFKNTYNTTLFQRENDAIFRNLTAREKKNKMEEYSGDFILFKKSREKIITARNRLLFSWTMVSAKFSHATSKD